MVRWYRNFENLPSPRSGREGVAPLALPTEGATRAPIIDQYIPPEASVQQKRTVSKWTWGFFSKRRAMEEVQEIASKAQRLSTATDPVICYFVENDLERLMQYGEALPSQTRQLLGGFKSDSKSFPWLCLLRVAAGDARAILPAIESAPEILFQNKGPVYLYGLQKLAVRFPKEATHLAKQIFEKGDLNTRLATFRVVIVSPQMGDGKLIGEFFVKLMAATTHEERHEIVEPFFQNLLQTPSPLVGEGWGEGKSNKLAWLSAIYHGWKQEA